MKRFKLLVVVASVLLAVGCNQQSAFQYNEKVVKIQKSLLDSIEFVGADSIAAEGLRLERIQSITKRKLNEFVALEPPKSGISLKDAFIKDVEALYTYNDILLQMTKLPENDTAIISLQDKLVVQKDKLDKCDDLLMVEQEKFAKTHSFRLENK